MYVNINKEIKHSTVRQTCQPATQPASEPPSQPAKRRTGLLYTWEGLFHIVSVCKRLQKSWDAVASLSVCGGANEFSRLQFQSCRKVPGYVNMVMYVCM